ncbi:TetR/AcrR family transcriptional regulator [Streptomyces fulvoviolaceus]|uniref:TetR/AcrR family transcriptional regulator n=1 Tax=Streptomyces fulvoviolaceus TaxID=285535 RepID=UPI0004C773E7|nr:TetR/AcrR family transcriptional regulator [Streptomyces fulvoviolaceus]
MSDAPRPLRADARRNRVRVLDAAKTVLTREGMSASMRSIAQHAGVGLGTVYRQFPTKEALYEAIVTEQTRDLVGRARSLAETGNPGEAFFTFFTHAVTDSTGQKMLVDALTDAGVDLSTGLLGEANRDLLAATETLLTRAQQAGAVRADVAMQELSALLSAACLAAERQQWDDALRTRVLGIFFDGLGPRT